MDNPKDGHLFLAGIINKMSCGQLLSLKTTCGSLPTCLPMQGGSAKEESGSDGLSAQLGKLLLGDNY